jgi:hypothetical protein
MSSVDTRSNGGLIQPAVFLCPRPWDSQGAQAAERKARQWIMARETRFFDSDGAQARPANENRTACHGTRCKKNRNGIPQNSNKSEEIAGNPVSGNWFFIVRAGILCNTVLTTHKRGI